MYRPLTFLDSLLVAPILLLPILSTAVAEPSQCGPDPQCRFHLDRGIALDREQKYELALAEFQTAYKQQPDPWVAVNVGRALHKLGRFAEALSWYRDAGRAAPADVELQKQLLEFAAQARQNLPMSPSLSPSVTVVNKTIVPPPPAVQNASSSSSSSSASATALNTTNVQVVTPPYKRASLWVPVVGVVLVAGAAGIAGAMWPRPYQPDGATTWIDYSLASTASVGGLR